MHQIQCPGCGTTVVITPVPGQVMGCPNCRTPLTVPVAPATPGPVQPTGSVYPTVPVQVPGHLKAGEMPVAAPPPPGTPVVGSVAPLAGGVAASPPHESSVVPGVTSTVRTSRRHRNEGLVPLFLFMLLLATLAIAWVAWYVTTHDQGSPSTENIKTDGRRDEDDTKTPEARPKIAPSAPPRTGWKDAVVVDDAHPDYRVAISDHENQIVRVPGIDGVDPAHDPSLGWVRCGDVITHIQAIQYTTPVGRNADGKRVSHNKKSLIVYLLIRNVGTSTIRYSSWQNSPYTATPSKSPETTRLVDPSGRAYPATIFPGVTSYKGHVTAVDISENSSISDALLFDAPPNGIKGFELSLPAAAVGQPGRFKFQIVRADRATAVPHEPPPKASP